MVKKLSTEEYREKILKERGMTLCSEYHSMKEPVTISCIYCPEKITFTALNYKDHSNKCNKCKLIYSEDINHILNKFNWEEININYEKFTLKCKICGYFRHLSKSKYSSTQEYKKWIINHPNCIYCNYKKISNYPKLPQSSEFIEKYSLEMIKILQDIYYGIKDIKFDPINKKFKYNCSYCENQQTLLLRSVKKKHFNNIKNQINGCKKCSFSNNYKLILNDKIIKRSDLITNIEILNSLINNFGGKLLYVQNEFINNSFCYFLCPKNHEIKQKIHSILKNKKIKCKLCAIENKRLSKNEIFLRLKKNNIKLAFDQENTNINNIYYLQCLNCSYQWSGKLYIYLNKTKCPVCGPSIGINAKFLGYYLQKKFNNSVIREFKIKIFIKSPIKVQNQVKVDYYIFYNNKVCIIEYQGEQHYKPVNFRNISNEEALKNFVHQQYRDSKIREYCQINKIELYEIDGRVHNTYEKVKTYVDLNIFTFFDEVK